MRVLLMDSLLFHSDYEIMKLCVMTRCVCYLTDDDTIKSVSIYNEEKSLRASRNTVAFTSNNHFVRNCLVMKTTKTGSHNLLVFVLN